MRCFVVNNKPTPRQSLIEEYVKFLYRIIPRNILQNPASIPSQNKLQEILSLKNAISKSWPSLDRARPKNTHFHNLPSNTNNSARGNLGRGGRNKVREVECEVEASKSARVGE